MADPNSTLHPTGPMAEWMGRVTDSIQAPVQTTPDRGIRFATIDSAYTSGAAYVVFDNTGAKSRRPYPWVSSNYTPVANDHVALAYQKDVGFVILGDVDGLPS